MRIFALDNIINYILVVSIMEISKTRLISEVYQKCCPSQGFTIRILLFLEKDPDCSRKVAPPAPGSTNNVVIFVIRKCLAMVVSTLSTRFVPWQREVQYPYSMVLGHIVPAVRQYLPGRVLPLLFFPLPVNPLSVMPGS